jgi:type I restriction enzyme M protein
MKSGKYQKTVLSDEEVKLIEDTFINREVKDDFSVIVPFDDIAEKGYSFSAGQYFEVKIEYVDITAEEFAERINEYMNSLSVRFLKGHELEKSIMEQMGGLKFDE